MTNEIFSDKEVIFRNARKWLAWFSAQYPSAATALRDVAAIVNAIRAKR
jgi:hypothetical protein